MRRACLESCLVCEEGDEEGGSGIVRARTSKDTASRDRIGRVESK